MRDIRLPIQSPLHAAGIAAWLALTACTAATHEDEPIKPFSSDKCSYYLEGTISQSNLWCHCCVEHDVYYWIGGTEQQRRDADNIFKQCIEQTGATTNANLMWLGVRLGGGPATAAGHRWGYGWPGYRPYSPLDERAQKTLAKQLLALPEQIQAHCSATTEKGPHENQ